MASGSPLQVNTVFFLEFVRQILDQAHIKIFTTQEGVTVGRQHFKVVLAINFSNFDNRDIEGTATQVINGDRVVALGFVHTVGQCRSGRLVDNTLNFQTSNLTGIFSCLTL